jgi:hypothetical protein
VIVLFTIRANQRKARDSNPHSPQGNRVSSAARPTVSGYLPSSFNVVTTRVDRRGVEPRFSACKAEVLPLDQQPIFNVANQGPPENRTRSGSLQESHAASALADRISSQILGVVPEGVEPPFPLCKRGVVAIGPRDAL